MNTRLRLTRVCQKPIEDKNITLGNIFEDIDTSDSESKENDSNANDNDKNVKIVSKYKPTVKWKEHFLSHYSSDVRNLAPLPLTNTDLFESKV